MPDASKNTPGKNRQREPDKMTNQAVARGQADLADNFAIVPDGLSHRQREKPLADQAIELIVRRLCVIVPGGDHLLVFIAKPLRPRTAPGVPARPAFLSRRRHRENTNAASRLWVIVAAVRSRIFLRILFQRQDRGDAKQQPDQQHGDQYADHVDPA